MDNRLRGTSTASGGRNIFLKKNKILSNHQNNLNLMSEKNKANYVN